MDKHEQAKQDYLNGMKYKDIATKYDVSLNTVKSWKKRHGWERGAPKGKSVHPKTEKVAPKIITELMNNDELTDKRKLFCLYYLQWFNATKAYQKAFNVDYETANAAGARLLVNVSIQKQLTALKSDMASDLHLNALDIAREYMKQAFADVGDYVEFGTKEVYARDGWRQPIKDKITKEYLMVDESYVNLKNQDEVDTTLIKSVHIGRDGVVVELYDKQKAQSELMKYLSNDYKLVEARTRKLDAEARIVGNKADKLTNNSQDNDLLSALSDVINGGDDSNETEVQSETDGEH